MDCCNANEKCLIVTTINPIWHSCPAHHGTKILSSHSYFVAAMQGKHHLCTLSSHSYFVAVMQGKHHLCTQFILKQNTNEAHCCLQIQLNIFFLSLGLGTSFQLQSILTLIVQRTVSKCKVHSRTTARNLESMSFCIFCYFQPLLFTSNQAFNQAFNPRVCCSAGTQQKRKPQWNSSKVMDYRPLLYHK